MARPRRNATPTATPTERKMNMAFEALTDESLAEVLSKSRSRGQYAPPLKEFIESGERGVQVSLDEGAFAGKKANSVKTGFETARRNENAPEGAKEVRVIVQNEKVYLINDGIAA